MKFFADTAELAEIKELAETGLLDGVAFEKNLVPGAIAEGAGHLPRSWANPRRNRNRTWRQDQDCKTKH